MTFASGHETTHGPIYPDYTRIYIFIIPVKYKLLFITVVRLQVWTENWEQITLFLYYILLLFC